MSDGLGENGEGAGRWTLFLSAFCGLAACLLAMGFGGPAGAAPASFLVLYGLSFLFLLGAVGWFPRSLGRGRALALIFLAAVIVRLPFLFLWPVNLDVMRYVWEGFVQTFGVDPYRLAPDHPALAGLAGGPMKDIFALINHKDLAACYPPLAQLLFRAVASVSPTPLAFKILFASCDLAAAAFLAGLLRRRGLPPSRLLLYAMNPLAVVYLAGEGHLDALQVLFVCAALWCFAAKRDGAGFFALGAAVMSKYLAVVLFPFFLTGKNWRKSLWFFAPFLSFVPFLDAGGGLFASAGVFGAHMSYNASLSALARLAFGPYWLIAVLVLLTACLAGIWLFAADRFRGAFLAAGATLLFLPSLFPWYLTLAAVFLPLFPSAAWIYLCAAMAWHVPVMAVEYATGAFAPPPWMAFWEYVPFYCLLVFGLFRPLTLFPARRFPPARSLAVVIPARDEEGRIGPCLASALARGEELAEIIVADGGSSDGTRKKAREMGARVISCPPGRGGQIRAGIEAATADAVLVLHADCVLVPETPKRVLAALNAHPEALGGAAGMRFTQGGAGSFLVERLNALRLRLTGVSFGDQGQFFRLRALQEAGGFPGTMLMEDVEAAFLQKRTGPVLGMTGGTRASGRTWRRRGFFGNFSRIVLLFSGYLVLRRLALHDPTGKAYYRRYYKSGAVSTRRS